MQQAPAVVYWTQKLNFLVLYYFCSLVLYIWVFDNVLFREIKLYSHIFYELEHLSALYGFFFDILILGVYLFSPWTMSS